MVRDREVEGLKSSQNQCHARAALASVRRVAGDSIRDVR
jgi:hypothetical protein